MIREALMDKGAAKVGDFRLRGTEVSRIEGFSDAAFAFAVTLLVVSLEVPRTFDDLLDVMRGVPAFAVCFAILVWLWTAHYKFFRRFALQDNVTIALNSVLLFVIMLYVYPLKYVFTMFMGMITGLRPSGIVNPPQHHIGDLFVIYGVGFVAVFAVFALMNLRALKLRDHLELSELENLLTRAEIMRCCGLMGVGVLSIVLAVVLPGGTAGLAGLVFSLIAVVEFVVGWRTGRRREVLIKNGAVATST